MLCPQCEKHMEHREKTYLCEKCRIAYSEITDKWDIPEDRLPSEKQVSTILFINNRLDTQFHAITKKQSWKCINRWFDKAKEKAMEEAL